MLSKQGAIYLQPRSMKSIVEIHCYWSEWGAEQASGQCAIFLDKREQITFGPTSRNVSGSRGCLSSGSYIRGCAERASRWQDGQSPPNSLLKHNRTPVFD
jgi:hypothetical protein